MSDFNPSKPSDEYLRRQDEWAMTRALLRGTKAMREAGKTYLPKFANESDEQYRRRLSVSVLYQGFARIVRTMASLPFGKDVQLQDDVPEAIRGRRGEADDVNSAGGWIEDIDRLGGHINRFAFRAFRCGLAHGAAHILVDMPAAGELEPGEQPRPRWVLVPPWTLLEARKAMVRGTMRYVYVRLLETVTENGEQKQAVREIEPGEWRLWMKGEKDWIITAQGAYDSDHVTMASFIPVSDDDEDAEAVFTGPSPLTNVAYLNVCHWQSASDQRNILTFSRFAVLVLRGVGGDSEVVVGPNSALKLPAEGDAKMLEPTGVGLEAGERDLAALERAMEQEGLQLLVRRAGNVTATEAMIDETKDLSDLQAMTLAFQDTLETALSFTAEWAGLGDGGSVKLNVDFGVTQNAEGVARIIMDLRKLGDLSAEDALGELQRVGIISDSADVEGMTARAREAAMLDIPAVPAEPDGADA